MRTLCTVAVMFGLAAATAFAAEGEMTEPTWVKRPTPDSLLRVWPSEALRKGVGGRALIDCVISEQGAVFGCKVVSETPEGMGFGAAAIALTPQFVFKPGTREGKPANWNVRLPIVFQSPGAPATGSHIPGGDLGPFARPIVTNPTWDAAPSYDQVVAAYPPAAASDRLGGRATLGCLVKDDGRLRSCTVINEEPSNKGFANAAKSLVPLFKAPANLSDGAPTSGAMAHIPFVFAPAMLDPARRVTGKVQWAKTPTGDAFLAGYPNAAKEAGVRTGRVVLDCETGAGGKLEGCQLSSEEPVGLGFGAAALALSPSFHVRPWTADGLPAIGGRVRVPIRYQIPATEAAPPRP